MNVYIDPSFIINKENWSLIASESICKICKGILYNPIQCSKCQLIFCKQCIENKAKNKNDINFNHECKNADYQNHPIIFDLEKLKFKCKNGCNEEIPYLELENHYTKNCSKIDFKSKYLEYKDKYESLLQKFKELENQQINNDIEINDIQIEDENNKQINIDNPKTTFKSKYHDHELKYNSLFWQNLECSICSSYFEPKTKSGFYCDECYFHICSKCQMLEKMGDKFEDIFKSIEHKHLLKKNTKNIGWRCDVCKSSFSGKIERFSCKKYNNDFNIYCDFDMCMSCVDNELFKNRYQIKTENQNNNINININYI